MAKKYTYVANGIVAITELVYEYGEEDPVEEKDMTLCDLTEDQFVTLENVLEAEEDLTKYIAKDSLLYGVVTAIRLGVDKNGSLTEIDCKHVLSQAQEEALIDYLTGQFSDGWGEGFHQYPFYESDEVLVAGFYGVNALTQKIEVQ